MICSIIVGIFFASMWCGVMYNYYRLMSAYRNGELNND